MGDNLPPGVSVSDLPGNDRQEYDAPYCKLCEQEDYVPWYVEVSRTDDGYEQAVCRVHGGLADEDWDTKPV